MGLDEQRPTALALQRLDHLPGLVRMPRRIGADQRDRVVAEVAGGPHRTELRMHEVGTATGVRNRPDLDQAGQLAFLGVDRRDLVGLVRRHQEVALGTVPATVVEETGRSDLGHLEVVDVGVVDHQRLAGLLHVDDEFRLEVRGHDRRDPRLRMVLLGVHCHTAGRHDLQRLQRVALHDDVLRRPVGACDRELVLEALVLGGIDRARLETDADLGDVVGLLHPQVDHVHLGVATDHVQVAPRSRQPRNVHRIAGLDDVDDLLGVAVDQRDLAGVA